MNNKSIAKKDNIDSESLIKLAKSYIVNEEYRKAEVAYNCLLGLEKKSIELVVSKAQVLKNQKRLAESISLLEMAVEIGFFDSKLLHILAIFYRDQKLWSKSEKCIWDIVIRDKNYASSLGFAIFASDILRKRGYVNSAYSIISFSIYTAECSGKKVPFNAVAIKEELNYETSCEYAIEISHRFYDIIYEGSDKYASKSDDSVYVPVWRKVLDFFQDNNVLNVVDIGCGPGQFAEYAIKRLPALCYTGFDYSSVAISQAKKRTKGVEFIEGNAFSSPLLTDNAADVYILLEVLEHIEKDLDLLGSMPSRASVVFSVPNFDSFGHVRFFLDEEEVFDRYTHLFSYLEVKGVVLKGYSTIYLAFGQLK